MPMHPLIPIHELMKLTSAELFIIEARLRDMILNEDMSPADRERCAMSLSNAVYALAIRQPVFRP